MKKYILPLLLFSPYITNACVGEDNGINIYTGLIAFFISSLIGTIIAGIIYLIIKLIYILLKRKRGPKFIRIFYVLAYILIIYLGLGAYQWLNASLLCA